MNDEYLKKIDEQLSTAQQCHAFEEYKAHCVECEIPLEFWNWYQFYCLEEGLYNDRASYQGD